MATKDETTQYLNQELDVMAKKLKTEKLPQQNTFYKAKADKVVVTKKIK